MKLLMLRVKKWWITKLIKYIYPNLPFEIAYTGIIDGITGYNYEEIPGQILAEFDINGRHYIIYESN